MNLQRNVLAHLLARGWIAVAVLVFTPVYVRLLGVEAWAIAGFFSTLLLWLTLLDAGFGQSAAREMALHTAGATSAPRLREVLRSVEALCLALGLVTAVLCWVAAPWVATQWVHPGSLRTGEVERAIQLAGIALALRLLEGLYTGALLGLQRVVPLAVLSVVFTTLRWGGAAAVLAWVSPTLHAFLLWQVAVSLLAAAAYAATVYAFLPPSAERTRVRRAALSHAWPFARGVAIATLLGVALSEVDKLLLLRLVDLQSYGNYLLAAMLAAALVHMVTPLAEVVRSRLTVLLAGPEAHAAAAAYHAAAQVASLMVLPAGLALALFPDDVLRLWTQDPAVAERAARLLSVLAVGWSLNGLMYIPYALQLAAGWPGLAARINAVAIVLTVPLLWWAASRYGAEGAAWVYVALNCGYVTIGIHLMHRRLLPAHKWRWYLQDVGQPLLAAAAVLAAARLLRPLEASAVLRASWLLLAVLLALLAAGLAAPVVRQALLRTGGRRLPSA